ncbi:hypothetical protein AC1031_001076 [Aphanomyces cochlioides]|nr:hypothetical protein AC1031_001076 [Aphanomyces cochlioides]
MTKILAVAAIVLAHVVTSFDPVQSHDEERLLAPTNCSVLDCKHGGCLYRGCKERIECSGGHCEFIDCADPHCQGGVCTFIESASGTCNGGLCKYIKPTRSLKEDYCLGGLCTVDGKEHPTSFSTSLSDDRPLPPAVLQPPEAPAMATVAPSSESAE